MPLNNAAVSVAVKGDYSGSLDLASLVSSLNINRGQAFDNGTGANQADKIWSDTRTLGISATEDLDLAGALTDAFGAALTFARIKALLVYASPGNINNVVIGGATNAWATLLSPAATGLLTIPPGGGFCAWTPTATGFAVTPATGDLLHVANGGAGSAVTYDVVILGASA